MKKRIKAIVISAVTTPATSFTWMKYKGVKGKLLTHVKRNGDEVKAKLLPGDVYGYRLFKKRGNPIPLIQIVLKSDGMDLAYNLNEKTFNSMVLKHSRATVLPKAFKKGIDTTIIDKKAKATPKLDSKTPKGSIVKRPKSVVGTKMTEAKTTFNDKALDHLNGFMLPNNISTKLGGVDPQLSIVLEGGVPIVYLIVYDPKILKEKTLEEVQILTHQLDGEGLYQTVIADSLSHVTWELEKSLNLPVKSFKISTSPITVQKSKAHPKHIYLKIRLGSLDLSLINPKPETDDPDHEYPDHMTQEERHADRKEYIKRKQSKNKTQSVCEDIVSGEFQRFMDSGRYSCTLGTNFPDKVEYSVSVGATSWARGKSVSIGGALEIVQDKLRDIGVERKSSTDEKQSSGAIRTVTYEHEGVTFTLRIRFVKGISGKFEIPFFEYIFPR